MDDVEDMVVRVRADTSAFARDVAAMRETLEGPFGAGVDRAGRALETTLARAVRTGKLGFEDLKTTALQSLAAIASAAVRSGIEEILGGGRGGSDRGGLLTALSRVVGGAPGRATGGPVSPGRAYLVGERGPEMFVPTSSGSVATGVAGAPREVRVAITINASGNASGGEAPGALAKSSRQVARAVKAALAGVED